MLLRRRRRRVGVLLEDLEELVLGCLAAALERRLEPPQRIAVAGQLLQDLVARPLDALEVVQPLVVQRRQLAQEVELLDLLLGRAQLLAQRLRHFDLVALALRQLGERAIDGASFGLISSASCHSSRAFWRSWRSRCTCPRRLSTSARVSLSRAALELALERRGHRRPALLLLHEPLELASALGRRRQRLGASPRIGGHGDVAQLLLVQIGQLGQPPRLIGKRRRLDRLLGDADQRRVVALLRQVLAEQRVALGMHRIGRQRLEQRRLEALAVRRALPVLRDVDEEIGAIAPLQLAEDLLAQLGNLRPLLLRRQQLLEPLDDEPVSSPSSYASTSAAVASSASPASMASSASLSARRGTGAPCR